MSEYVQIGYTQKTHGVGGEIRIFIEDNYEDDFLQASVVFLDMDGQMVPYFVEYIRGNHADILKFEDISSREEAQKLKSRQVYLRAEDLEVPAQEAPAEDATGFAFLEGFEVFDLEMGSLGPILRIDEYPHQEMAVINYKGREVMIPLHESLVESVDKEKRAIHLALPEGLLDL